MKQTAKKGLFIKLLACFVLLFSTLGVLFSGFNPWKSDVTANAETVEYQDLLGVENRSWGAASDEYYFGGVTLDPFGYFNSADSVNGCWNVTWDASYVPAFKAANNGVDIMEYIYINGESARAACTQNGIDNKYVGANGGWLANGGVCAPVYVETTNGSGIIIKILKAYAGENYTLTFKAGFSLIRNDGKVIYVSDDIIYNCVGNVPTKVQKSTVTFNDENGNAYTTKRVVTGQAIGELPAVPEKAGYVGFWKVDGVALTEETVISTNKTATPVYALDYTDLFGVENRDWGAASDEYYFGGVTLSPFGYFNSAASVCGCWNVTWDASYVPAFKAANNGVDIMEYIYINGESARAACTQNGIDNKYVGANGGWLANGGVCAPVYVETHATDGIIIKILKAYAGESFTLTFKKGFSLIRKDGAVIYLAGDVIYTYADGVLGGRTVEKEYKLSFEGTDVRKTLKNGAEIGELPAVPAKDGCEGAWYVDGAPITADTVYNYGANKTATAVYSKNITDTVNLGDWGVPETESDIRYLWVRNNGADILTSYPNSYWNDHADNKNSNFGVDIMEYILIDGESARSLVTKNQQGETSYKAASTFPLSAGSCYAPVCIETASNGVRFKVMVDYKTTFKVTFKAGFTLVTSDGVRLYVDKDVSYNVGATMNDITKVTGALTLTFEGAGEKDIDNGATIGELPAVPPKDGYVGVWTIDGVEITADTVYNYGVNKTATAVYKKDVTETVKIEFAYHNAIDSKFKIFITPAAVLTSNNAWNIQDWSGALIAANNGVDIMNYIYVNGENIRTLSDNNRTNNTYPLGDATGWLGNSDQCRPVFVETNGEGIWVNVLHSFSGEEYRITLKAGFAILDANGGTSVITEDVEFICTTGGGVNKVAEYTLTFEGGETRNIKVGQPIGELPAVPANANDSDCEGVWTIDGVEITADTIYTFGENKTAVPSYRKDITKYIALENRAWGAASDEYYFGVLDMREANKVVNGDSTTYYLNTNVADCWYHGNNGLIEANGGVDIMEYILINGKSAREIITNNYNSGNPIVGTNGWLTNPAASPVYVETTNGSGIMIKVLKGYVREYFEITLKSGFSLINEDGVRVYLTKDVTYKYIANTGDGSLAKGEFTEAELDQFDGKNITLINGSEPPFTKKTVRLTLPELEAEKKNGIMQTFIGWTTDPANLSDLYPAGYKWEVKEGDVLYAVWIGFEMQDGAAVRLTQGSAGIRFLVDISQADINAYYFIDNPIIQTWGVLLAPTDYLNHVSAFTYEALGANCTLKDCSDLWKVEEEEKPIWTYAAAFVNIKEPQFSRRFSARGYLEINYTTGTGYVYTPYVEENNARSIYEVALMAYDDAENPWYQQNTTIKNYINNVANITWNEADYSFAANRPNEVTPEITGISLDGYTVTVTLNGDITSAVVNGARLAKDSAPSNVQLGSFVFSVSGFEFVAGGFKFTIGAANDTYDKLSEETLYFASSDADLDFFLNDYFKRHSAYVENGENLKVNTAIGGVNSQEFFSQEWLSMAYYWYNSFEGYTDENGNVQDRIAGLRQFLSTVPVDDYGYVWSSNDNVRDAYSEVSTGEQKMGWPFPNNDTVKTTHWEFNGSDSSSWSSNINAKTSGGLFTKNVSNQASNITFTSNSVSSKKIYTKYAPLLEFEVRIDDATNVEDIYVWYTTSSSTSFSIDKRVSVNEKAFIKYDYNGKYEHVLYLPMYAESAWGESTSTYVKQIKIEIVLKSGKTISGNVGLNYVRPTLDTRMSNNNSILISSLRTDYDYTGDLEFLTENITRARKAMNFLMQMYDSTRGLKKESYLVGHGGTKEDLTWLGKATVNSIADSISQGYWDIMYMPEYDFQSNTYFYKAVRDMAYLEKVLANNGITVDEDATVKTATRNRTTGTCAYNYDLNSVADTVLANLRQTTENTNHTGFWNATEGRFVAGYASGEGRWYDYGYVAWNLEAIYYGIATEEQAEAIMNWLASEDDLYKYAFAPMSITLTGDADALNGEYAAKGDKWVNCQFGGAIMYTSFYDLMARINTKGADDAFARLTAIQAWYEEVYAYYQANGTNPEDFYRYYYDNQGIQMQGTGTAGAVGLDDEFLESFLPVSAVAYGFFGIDSIDGKTLEIAPELPADLDYWKMENLAFNMVKYDATICKNAIVINNVRGDTAGLQLQLALDYTQGQKVYVNGVEVQPTKVENGKAYVTVAFGAAIVEVR